MSIWLSSYQLTNHDCFDQAFHEKSDSDLPTKKLSVAHRPLQTAMHDRQPIGEGRHV